VSYVLNNHYRLLHYTHIYHFVCLGNRLVHNELFRIREFIFQKKPVSFMGYCCRNVFLLRFKTDHRRTSPEQKRNRDQYHCPVASGSGGHHALSAGLSAYSCGPPCYFILFGINFSSYLPLYDHLEALLHESGALPALSAWLTGDNGFVCLSLFPDRNREHGAGNIFHPVLYHTAGKALPQNPGSKDHMEIIGLNDPIIKHDKKGKYPEEKKTSYGH
jgi:hypothetical protein